tara:strand:+ start:2785 stop:3363 length:579 start_codon:yes stop_codon:yes gene_type:complete
MILIVDNYDSFTFNLAQYLGEREPDIEIWRNDRFSLKDIQALNPDHIVLSPGPGRPSDAGHCLAIIEKFYKTVPILGICLGHQAISEFFGAKIVKAPQIIHGKVSQVNHFDSRLMESMPNPLTMTRYHSLIAQTDSIPNCLKIVARVDQLVMAIEHIKYPLFGLQFHPESIASEGGKKILYRFLDMEKVSEF